MDLEFSFGLKDPNMKDNGRTINSTVMVHFIYAMVIHIKDNGYLGKHRDMGFLKREMDQFMKANGSTTNRMASAK